ncbi:MAG: DUF4258 domain-containing protein [Anaerolineae bacterium]|nr:DUF4258 domain-containing protein [Anaerolineae bacterium]
MSPADIRYAIFHGKIIESYRYPEQPEIDRCLIQASLPTHLPLHVVIELIIKTSVVVVTAYIPDRRKWVSFQKRKHNRGGEQ